MMEAMVEFTGGGPLDGKVLASGENPEFSAEKALWILRVIGATIDNAARKEEKPGTLLIWRQPSPEMNEQAKAEKGSQHQIAALMKYHLYHITSFEETEGLVLFKAYYRGVD